MGDSSVPWDTLASCLSGSLVRPGEAEFTALRKPFVGQLTETLPQAVARCAGTSDVVQAVTFARSHQLPLAIRSGGHSFADFCTTSGLLIDLGLLDTVRLEAESATVGPGIRLGALARELAVAGRMVPVGWNPLVAVGGAVLGGGYGPYGRSYGLGCDHLLAAEVVLADGTVTWVDDQHDPDLYWALCGAGGGNFGVVTALVLRTRPLMPVTTFVHRWPWPRAAEAVDAWQRWAPSAPDELNAELVVQALGTEEPRLVLFGTALSPPSRARPALEELIGALEPGGELDELTELSRSAAPLRHTYAGAPVLERPQPGPPEGMRPWLRAVKSEFFDQLLPAAAITGLVDAVTGDRADGQYRELELIPWGGALAQPAPADTAFPHRDSLFQIGHHAMVANPAGDRERAAARDWVRRSWDAVHPWGAGKVYPNYPDQELVDWARAYYGDNLPRLSRVKAAYDPEDVFHFAQSVPLPAGDPPGDNAPGR